MSPAAAVPEQRHHPVVADAPCAWRTSTSWPGPTPRGVRQELDDLLARLAGELPALSDTITRDYLSHAQASRHFASQSLAQGV